MFELRNTALVAAIVVCAALSAPARAEEEDQVARGKYLVTIMGCGDCHTPGYFFGKPDLTRRLSGSDVGFEMPGLGIHWGPNLTPDPETGLGKWSDTEIIAAFRTGVTPDGRKLLPVMPYGGFAALTDADAQAIVAFLRSLPPVVNKVTAPVKPGEKPAAPYMTVIVPK